MCALISFRRSFRVSLSLAHSQLRVCVNSLVRAEKNCSVNFSPGGMLCIFCFRTALWIKINLASHSLFLPNYWRAVLTTINKVIKFWQFINKIFDQLNARGKRIADFTCKELKWSDDSENDSSSMWIWKNMFCRTPTVFYGQLQYTNNSIFQFSLSLFTSSLT